MSAATVAASIAAASGVAAYLNGKYHVAQDIRGLRFKRKAGKYYEELGKSYFDSWEKEHKKKEICDWRRKIQRIAQGNKRVGGHYDIRPRTLQIGAYYYTTSRQDCKLIPQP